MSIGNFPERLSQQILAGRLGAPVIFPPEEPIPEVEDDPTPPPKVELDAEELQYVIQYDVIYYDMMTCCII